MIRKVSVAAFTLIELLIVITIIAVLAGIALPAYNGVKERGDQTKDLSNAKQIALALRQFAIDNNGSYPNKQPDPAAKGDYSLAGDAVPANSNQAFWWLIPTYIQGESIFSVTGSAFTPGNPDNKTDDQATSGWKDTLKAGENNFAYVTGLSDTSPSNYPLLADGFKTGTTPGDPAYDTNKARPGGVWAGKKAVVVFCDSSGQIMKLDTTQKATRTNSAGGRSNLFAPASDWLDADKNPVLNPAEP
ncbi:MAG TPA: type II secretion system protein [Chthoniobacterales bacterium]|nr:type II secretion system protein [Chthoniobacterales bacterium]